MMKPGIKRYYKKPEPRISKNVPEWYLEFEDAYIDALERKAEIEKEIEELRESVLTNLRANRRVHIETERTNTNYIKESNAYRIDAVALKRDYPEVFAELSTPIKKKAYITVTIKK